MKYNKISYLDKLDQLQAVYGYSNKLAEAIGISRRTLPNWRDKPESIKSEHQLNIDVLYCQHFIISAWDDPKKTFEPILLPDDFSRNDALFIPFLRRLSFGTVEIETHITQDDLDKIIDEKKLPKNISRQLFHEGLNAYLTHRQMWQRIVEHNDPMLITEESIKTLHTNFMRGVFDNAGFYSKKIRVMGRLENVHTTEPDDIEEEMNRWVYKEAKAASLESIAKAHAHFILIHPFGDGNGRVARVIVMAQCLNARLKPPIFNGENRAMYYSTMEYAIKHGRYAPLARLFYEATKE